MLRSKGINSHKRSPHAVSLYLITTLTVMSPAVTASECVFGVSGLWADQNSLGDGFNVVQVSSSATAIYYYGHDAEGNSLWLLSDTLTEAIEPGRAYVLPMMLFPNGTFDAPDPAFVTWGTLSVSFQNEGVATFELDGEDGAKRFEAERFAPIQGNGCGQSAEILEIYYGLDSLPAPANLLCGFPVAGLDGMPVTFSVQLDPASVSPDDFVVETADGQQVTPDCATLQPAVESLERRTVLLIGTFGTADAQPRATRVVGTIQDQDGNPITGLRSDEVTPLEAGPRIVLAERYLPTNPGIGGECPAATSQVIQLVWGGGVSGPQGAALGEDQRAGVMVSLGDGSSVRPIALADDDPDNFVYACVEEASPAIEVSVDAGLFHDPGDDANPLTTARIVDRTP